MDMKPLFIGSLLMLSSVFVFSKTGGLPQEDISQVVVKAKAHFEKERSGVGDYYIQRVEFKNQFDELHPRFWEVVFLKVPLVKGGHVIVRVYEDGKIDSGFGE